MKLTAQLCRIVRYCSATTRHTMCALTPNLAKTLNYLKGMDFSFTTEPKP